MFQRRTPEEIIDAVAIEYISTLTESIIREGATVWSNHIFAALNTSHIVREQTVAHLAITII